MLILTIAVTAIAALGLGFSLGWYKGCRYMKRRLTASVAKMMSALSNSVKTNVFQMQRINELQTMNELDLNRHIECARRIN